MQLSLLASELCVICLLHMYVCIAYKYIGICIFDAVYCRHTMVARSTWRRINSLLEHKNVIKNTRCCCRACRCQLKERVASRNLPTGRIISIYIFKKKAIGCEVRGRLEYPNELRSIFYICFRLKERLRRKRAVLNIDFAYT